MKNNTKIDTDKNNTNENNGRRRSNPLKKLIIPAVIIALISIFLTFENKHIVITEYSYSNALIGEDMNGFCIVQISDLHNASFGKNNSKLIQKIEECKPDIIVLTGDLVDGSTHTNVKTAVSFAEQVSSICPVYYVTGNHEYYISREKREELFAGLENTGVIILNDSSVYISKTVQLIGLDDNSLMSNSLSTFTGPESLDIVLAHEPQYLERYSTNNADLALTGHAHGGQFRLPFIGAVYAPDQGINPKYTEGIHTFNNTQMIVSRGLGNSVFPFRLFNHPEIVSVRLVSE